MFLSKVFFSLSLKSIKNLKRFDQVDSISSLRLFCALTNGLFLDWE